MCTSCEKRNSSNRVSPTNICNLNMMLTEASNCGSAEKLITLVPPCEASANQTGYCLNEDTRQVNTKLKLATDLILEFGS